MQPPLAGLADAIRLEAVTLRRWGADSHAAAAEGVADRIERRLEEWRLESLTITDAATESRYSAAHLRRLVAQGKVPNEGSKGSPRIRRADLPKKPSRQGRSFTDPDLAADVLRARGLEQL